MWEMLTKNKKAQNHSSGINDRAFFYWLFDPAYDDETLCACVDKRKLVAKCKKYNLKFSFGTIVSLVFFSLFLSTDWSEWNSTVDALE